MGGGGGAMGFKLLFGGGATYPLPPFHLPSVNGGLFIGDDNSVIFF